MSLGHRPGEGRRMHHVQWHLSPQTEKQLPLQE